MGPNRLVGKRVRLPSGPKDKPEMRTGDYLRTMSKLSVLDSELENVKVTLNTYAEVDTVGIDFIR